MNLDLENIDSIVSWYYPDELKDFIEQLDFGDIVDDNIITEAELQDLLGKETCYDNLFDKKDDLCGKFAQAGCEHIACRLWLLADELKKGV